MYQSYSRSRSGVVTKTESSVVWGKLLFNLVSIPFVLLLMALVATQIISVRNYAATVESQETQPDAFIHEKNFY